LSRGAGERGARVIAGSRKSTRYTKGEKQGARRNRRGGSKGEEEESGGGDRTSLVSRKTEKKP